jgi:hypothetical protein
MKNIILLTILLFITSKAFAVEAVKFRTTQSDELFHRVFQTRYCIDISCSKTYVPSHNKKINANTVQMIFNQATSAIIENLKLRHIDILDTDFFTTPNEYELIDLMTLDFSSADGDTPLSNNEINRVMSLVHSRDAKTAIMGVVTEEGVNEYLLIYTPKADKIFILERSQFSKKKEF